MGDTETSPENIADLAMRPLMISITSFLLLDVVFILLFSKKYGHEFACRITSFIHAVVSMMAAIYVIVISPAGVFDSWAMPINPLQNTRPEQLVAISISTGYFIADTLMMIVIPEMRSFIYFGHHFISLVGVSIPIWAGRYGAVTAASLFWLESTNPQLNGRWVLLRILNLHEKKSDAQLRSAVAKAKATRPLLFKVFDYASKTMLAQYIPARFIFLPVSMYRTLSNTTSETTIDALYVCQASTSVLFLYFSVKFFINCVRREWIIGPGSWE